MKKDRALSKLRKLQMSDGGWHGFWKRAGEDRYINTNYIRHRVWARRDHSGLYDRPPKATPRAWNMMQKCLRYLMNRSRS